MTSPTQRSLKEMRSRGYTCQVVEHWNAFGKRRVDLWGWGDIICMKDGEIVLIQTTTSSNLSARIKKAVALPSLKQWLKAGGRALFTGWKKVDGKWTFRQKEIKLIHGSSMQNMQEENSKETL